MKKPVLCMLCESKPAANTCSMCGRVVCDDHFDASTGICIACKARRATEDITRDALK